MNFKHLKSFKPLINLDAENWIVSLRETLSEREKKMLISSSSEDFMKNILVFKDDFTYYLFKPTHYLYSFESLNDLLSCLNNFYRIHMNNRSQIKADRETQQRIFTQYKEGQSFSCMNLLNNPPDISYFTDRIFDLSRWEQTILDPEKFEIPRIGSGKSYPFSYKGYDWIITWDSFWLVGYDQPPKNEYDKIWSVYSELKTLAFETDRYVMYSAVNGIMNPR